MITCEKQCEGCRRIFHSESTLGEAEEEFKTRMAGANLGGDAGGGRNPSQVDLNSVTLTSAELATANKMLRSGMIASLDDYKREKVALGLNQ